MSLDICDARHPEVDAVCSAGRLTIGVRTTSEQLAAWVEDLRAEPGREVETCSGTITASTLLERYIDAGQMSHLGEAEVVAALHRYGWL